MNRPKNEYTKDVRNRDNYRKGRRTRITLRSLSVIVLLIIFSSCDVVSDMGKRSVVIIPLNNQRNCTPADVYDANGDYLGTIKAHKTGTVEAERSVFDDPQDETYVSFQTPDHMTEQILNGERGVIPQGCTNWGYDEEIVRLEDGYETESEDIRLDPPDYWEEPDYWD